MEMGMVTGMGMATETETVRAMVTEVTQVSATASAAVVSLGLSRVASKKCSDAVKAKEAVKVETILLIHAKLILGLPHRQDI